jgi:Predicted nucleic acid-binding protein, contains PIN domain
MPRVIVDTDILLEFSRGSDTAADRLEKTAKTFTLSISSITEMELIVGSLNKKHLYEIRRFIEHFQVVNISEKISSRASGLIEQYCLSHGLLIPDALIAATALTFDEGLATKNQRDFRFIEGLRLIAYP